MQSRTQAAPEKRINPASHPVLVAVLFVDGFVSGRGTFFGALFP